MFVGDFLLSVVAMLTSAFLFLNDSMSLRKLLRKWPLFWCPLRAVFLMAAVAAVASRTQKLRALFIFVYLFKMIS